MKKVISILFVLIILVVVFLFVQHITVKDQVRTCFQDSRREIVAWLEERFPAAFIDGYSRNHIEFRGKNSTIPVVIDHLEYRWEERELACRFNNATYTVEFLMIDTHVPDEAEEVLLRCTLEISFEKDDEWKIHEIQLLNAP